MNANRFLQQFSTVSVALCVLALSACGGGYGGGGMATGACGAYGSCTPTVTVTNMAGTVSGTVALTATAAAAGSYTVSNVQFKVDGTAVGAALTTAPFSFNWVTTTVANGAHMITAVVTDSANQTMSSAAVTLMVSNPAALAMTLAAEQLFPMPATHASGTGRFTVSNGTLAGSVMLSGVSATRVEIGAAFAGAQGAVVTTLVPNASHVNQWDVPDAMILSPERQADLAAGRLYVLVRSTANPNGELRAQWLPAGVSAQFAPLSAPAAASGGQFSGQVAVTVDAAGRVAAVHVNVAGLMPVGAELDSASPGATAATLATLTVDPNDAHHYFNDGVALTRADAANFSNGQWSATVFSATNPQGALRGELAQSGESAAAQ